MPERATTMTVAGQEFKVSTPDRVFYPATGTTKANVIAYYLEIADAMLPHLAGRPATRKRWPDGVDGPEFFAKDLEVGTPAWLTRVQIRHSSGPKFYPVMDTPAALGWLGQVAALELHVPQWRIETDMPGVSATSTVRHPDRVVFDLDPGPGVGLAECVEVALYLRERLGPLGARVVPVTSGSKGLHLYVPMDQPITSAQATEWARVVAEQVEKAMPTLVVSRMTRALRHSKILIDWSQNSPKKTTAAPYSLRGRPEPTVAAPRTWVELTAPGLAQLTYQEVLERVAAGIDPLASLLVAPAQALSRAVGDVQAPPAGRPAVRVARPRSLQPLTTTERPKTSTRRRPPAADTAGAAAAVLPADLSGPVELELAKAVASVPGPHAMPGGSLYELKWDGYRGTIVRDADGARLWSRQRNDLSAQFPELIAAAAALPPGTVIDGEAVIWNGARLDFDLLQRRLAGGVGKIAQQVREHPASYVMFDLLAIDGQDLRSLPLRERRARLENLAASLEPPLHLSPLTDDLDVATDWMAGYRPAGIEGLVIKGAGTRYEPGARRWSKFKSRETTEVIVGAVTGPINAPETIIAGLYRGDELVIAGRSVPLKPAQSRSLAAVLTAAGPRHPWPDTIISSRFGNSRDRTTITKVEPLVVAEVAADTGRQGGVWRHPLRFQRYRADLAPTDLPALLD